LIAIIPARGGSKRIPRKNVRSFFGVPILAHTINQIMKTEMFSQIVVSTEDAEISQIAKDAGAKVLIRDPELADDFTTTVDVIAASVIEMQNAGQIEEEVCCVYPITPQFSKKYLEIALKLLREEKLDYVFTAKQFQSSPARALKVGVNGKSEMCFPQNLNTRTQDLPPLFHDAALFYLGTNQAWQGRKPILNGNSKFIEVGKHETYDVDDEDDWEIMLNNYSRWNSNKDSH
jgi:N-acylneuraminate cytidylyltransferase